MIPNFTSGELLPEGEHHAEHSEFDERFGWNSLRRRQLQGLAELEVELWKAGCQRIWVCGSFVTPKDYPGDVDVIYDTTGMDEDLLEPVFFDFSNGRAAQKARFGCEFFPANMIERSTGKTFLEFFQTDRNGTPQGIVELSLIDPVPRE